MKAWDTGPSWLFSSKTFSNSCLMDCSNESDGGAGVLPLGDENMIDSSSPVVIIFKPCSWRRWLLLLLNLWTWPWLWERKNAHNPQSKKGCCSKKMVCGAEFLRISQLSFKQKHTCQHHFQWLGLFLLLGCFVMVWKTSVQHCSLWKTWRPVKVPDALFQVVCFHLI